MGRTPQTRTARVADEAARRDADRATGRARWGRLPEPVALQDMREGQPGGESLDPGVIHDPERDFLVRCGAVALF